MNPGKPQATFRRALVGIREARDLATHAMRGALFELHFWRDAAGHEVDLLVERAGGLRALEIKSGRTIAADWLDGLEHFARISGAAGGMPGLPRGASSN